MSKVICKECGWIGNLDELLNGINPFDNIQEISACPSCKELNDTIYTKCDHSGCKNIATCGTSTKEGYRLTCNQHFILG